MKRRTKVQILGNTLIYLTIAGILFTLILISLLVPWLRGFAEEKLYWVFIFLVTASLTLYLKELVDKYAE